MQQVEMGMEMQTHLPITITDEWIRVKKRWVMIGGLKGGLYQHSIDKSMWRFRDIVVHAENQTLARAELKRRVTEINIGGQWVSWGRGMIIVGKYRGKLYRNTESMNTWKWKDYTFEALSAENAIDHLIKLQRAG
ncbi:MAG: hypothetical protein ACXVDB_01575 [Tumebacillaceae bacterium]